MASGRKIFVGSLPDGCTEEQVRTEFGRYGSIDEIYLKAGAEPGRQWAFVTFATADEANYAKELTDRTLQFPGAERPVEVLIAKNQGKFGQPADGAGAGAGGAAGPKKIFVGSLPDGISEALLSDEYSKFGNITEIHLKTGCDYHKQWAFITYSTADEADYAKTTTDKVLTFPGSEKAVEVLFAKNQGKNGQDPMRGPAAGPAAAVAMGPTKIFVGSLPDDITETLLRSEFSRYGQITDVHLKTGCEHHKQWAFVTFGNHKQAQHAKDSTDRTLIMPGGTTPVNVIFAKNQGKNGEMPMAGGGRGAAPPPPMAAPMANNGWITYYTQGNVPYYYNHINGLTQWDCPPELQPRRAPPRPPQAPPPQGKGMRVPPPTQHSKQQFGGGYGMQQPGQFGMQQHGQRFRPY